MQEIRFVNVATTERSTHHLHGYLWHNLLHLFKLSLDISQTLSKKFHRKILEIFEPPNGVYRRDGLMTVQRSEDTRFMLEKRTFDPKRDARFLKSYQLTSFLVCGTEDLSL